MEFEHLFHAAGFLVALKLMFVGSMLLPAAMDRPDLYHAAVRKLATVTVTFGPMGLLIYVLYQVSRLA
jgi:hypothetical protein